MKYSLEAKIESDIKLPAKRRFELEGFDVEIAPNDEGILARLTVAKSVSADEFSTTMSKTGTNSWEMRVVQNWDVREVMVNMMRKIESEMAYLWGGVVRVHWDLPREGWEAETKDEDASIAFSSIERSLEYPPMTPEITESHIGRLAAQFPVVAELLVPKAFWREGVAEFRERRYIQAFTNFYYVIEGIHGNGRSSEREVLKVFARTEVLPGMCRRIWKDLHPSERHWKTLDEICTQETIPMDADGLLKLVVRMRNRAHHYARKSTRTQPSPFDQPMFESLAWLTMGLARVTLDEQERDARRLAQGQEPQGEPE